GALTLVLRARPGVPEEVTAGTRTVGVRLSPHPVALGLVRALRAPVTAPSANPSGLEPPTTASVVLAYFRDAIDLVVDGGATAGGEPSTVLDTTVDPPRVLRLVVERVGSGDVVIPRVGGQLETLHALYAKSCLGAIEARLVAGRLKIVEFFHDVRVVEIAEREVARYRDPALVFMNVNTPEELERARQVAAHLSME